MSLVVELSDGSEVRIRPELFTGGHIALMRPDGDMIEVEINPKEAAQIRDGLSAIVRRG